ncbi:MAG: hypothetical protein VX246_15055 [Myxococcota bacterium]|nr:hypothetical protein [Myxococcota bacterium]
MSPKIAACVLFVAAFIALPLPMFIFEASVPAARIAQIALATIALAVSEGTQGIVGMAVALFVGQAVLYTALLALAAWASGHYLLARLHHRVRDHVTVILSVLLISIAAYGELYDSRFHHSSPQANLLELYW